MSKATLSVGECAFKTYPFSDPDPVPATDERRYPYFRYDGSVDTAEIRRWKVVTLENDRIAVKVLPEVGGKIWSAYDKVAGRDFLYVNHVMKFRDVAMRGPWLSGGIEFNFGVFGHSPATATPVDWHVRENPDGSVSCFVGGDEYVTRTRWQVEILLRPDADEFETRTTWSNVSGTPAPYYHWMNAAYSLRDDPEFMFPGEVVVGHEGETVTRTWPHDPKGRDISLYRNNAHGGHKSFHFVGGNSGFYGIWWRDIGYGSYHRSLPYAKYGRKIWLWALSREGGIWEDLLTDSDGPYAELQSGRCFNQPRWGNVYTPFKHPTFLPGTVETFTDRWGPIRKRDDVALDLSAPAPKPRPIDPPASFDWEGAEGLSLLGVQALRTGDDADAEAKLRAALGKDPTSVKALAGLAELAYRRGQYARVHEFADRVFSVDLYDGEANYLDGAAFFAEGDLVSSRDRLGVAAFSGGYRAAAFSMIARSYLKEGRAADAEMAVDESLRCEGFQSDALLVKAILLRGTPGLRPFAEDVLSRMPLFHAMRYEIEGEQGLSGFVRNELPDQTYIEIGSWYEETGLKEDAARFFRLALPDPVAEVRLAFLEGREPVLDGPVAGVFPFRRETLPALEHAVRATTGWKAKYLLSVLKGSFGDRDAALSLLESCGETPDEAVFYMYRARLRSGAARIADLTHARTIEDGWRIGRDLAAAYEQDGDFENMRKTAEEYVRLFPGKNPLQLAYAQALLHCCRYGECMEFLKDVKILPSEHRGSATDIWQECQRALGLPVTWPENLGKGEPYHDGEWRQNG